jgi:23S rRNA (pseudouridine1915-N3)-methyltransferase
MCIGKSVKGFLEDGEKHYLDKLKHYINFKVEMYPDVKQSKQTSEDEIKKKEGELFLSKLGPSDTVILLDERGKQYSSVDFADFLQSYMNRGLKTLVFVVGGPYGFSEEMYKRANGQLSLSKMTLTHQMIRLFFIEQVYRGMTILKNEPYHHQ